MCGKRSRQSPRMIHEWNQQQACHHHPTPCKSTCKSTKAPTSPEMSAQTTRPGEGTATRPFHRAQQQTIITMQATLIRHWRYSTAPESTTCAFAATPAGCKVNVAQTQTTASTRLQ